MLYHQLSFPRALALALTLASACGDDDSKTASTVGDDPSQGPTVLTDGGRKSTGVDMDAGRRDAGGSTTTGGSTAADGSVTADAGTNSDAAVADLDAGYRDAEVVEGDAGVLDAGAGDAGDAAADAASADAADAADAGSADAGRDAGADAGPCDVADPRFGCGTRLSPDWIHFSSGLDIDTKYGRAWSPVVEVSTLAELRTSCQALVIGTLSQFEVPEVDDVRTLAAGCEPTLPAGSCQVQNGLVLPSDSGDCTCNTGVGPNDGKFCRAEVPDCETLWTGTDCGANNAECPTRRSWFYDVRTGSLVLAAAGQGVAQEAKGRCVSGISYSAP